MQQRPSWDQIWSNFSTLISERSYDPRTKVGAVVVTEDNTQVLSVGYNGNHRGGANHVDSTEPGLSGFIHAEVNALVKMDYNNPKKKVMYVTHSPCVACAKLIINANIHEVKYLEEYRDSSGVELLKSFGVWATKLEPLNFIKKEEEDA
jgi:dCMP deaminase